MSVEIEFPFEFVVAGTALSMQAKLATGGHNSAARLLAWAALQAPTMWALRSDYRQPSSAASLVGQLGYWGIVSQAAGEQLRSIAIVRSRIAHGDLAVKVEEGTIETLAGIVEGNLAEPELQATNQGTR